MKEHPILFSGVMVNALLARRKRVTRRISRQWLKVRAGDRLWVRETFNLAPGFESDAQAGDPVWYAADGQPNFDLGRWRPSIHMPRWASRITLEALEDARLERLHDITEEDAQAEGIRQLRDGSGTFVGREGVGRDGVHRVTPWPTAKYAFSDLWQTLHTKPGERWDDNPLITRVGEFRVIDAR